MSHSTAVTVSPATTAESCPQHSLVRHCHRAGLCLHLGHHSPHIPPATTATLSLPKPRRPLNTMASLSLPPRPPCPHLGCHSHPVPTTSPVSPCHHGHPVPTKTPMSPCHHGCLVPTQPLCPHHDPSVPHHHGPLPGPGRSPLPAGPPGGAGRGCSGCGGGAAPAPARRTRPGSGRYRAAPGRADISREKGAGGGIRHCRTGSAG